MGGKSSSSSSNQTTTNQIDERIAATGEAIVITDGSEVTFTDQESIKLAGEFGLLALQSNAEIAKAAITNANASADQALGQNDKFLEFADNQAKNDGDRTFIDSLPWLIGGVSILAISGAIKFGR